MVSKRKRKALEALEAPSQEAGLAEIARPYDLNDSTEKTRISRSLMLRTPLLIASLGNPGRNYANTRHNAGHILLSAIANHLGYPQFTNSIPHARGLISQGPNALLWQCPAFMNVSGPSLAKTWKRFLRDLPDEERAGARLVVVHDELESSIGKIRLKKGGSPRGHNGLKSCKQSLPQLDFWRLGIGIGRPASRESNDVADFVLQAMTVQEERMLMDGVHEAVSKLDQVT